MAIDYDLVRSRRRTVSVEIRPDMTVLVRAPKRMPLYEIDRFVDSNEVWIEKHLEKVRKRNEKTSNVKPLSREELMALGNEAVKIIPGKVRYYADKLGVTYGRITIRNQKTLWGSCSAKGNLNFNCLLMKAPEAVQDYVIVHELCHRLEMNHSRKFWDRVSAVLPDYKKYRKWLKEEGAVIMAANVTGNTK
ncbi:MAG: M48 family metallopeptidase [Lachnospiraceae bacterium]|nr:M48 family metallopeptidase [Lachnospiraceae bacterium]